MNIKKSKWKVKTAMFVIGSALAFSIATAMVKREPPQNNVIRRLAGVCFGTIDQLRKVQEQITKEVSGDDIFYTLLDLRDHSIIYYDFKSKVVKKGISAESIVGDIYSTQTALMDSLLRLHIWQEKPSNMGMPLALKTLNKSRENPLQDRPLWLTNALAKTHTEYGEICRKNESQMWEIMDPSPVTVSKQNYPDDMLGRLEFICSELRFFTWSQWDLSAAEINDSKDRKEYYSRLSQSGRALSENLESILSEGEMSVEVANWYFHKLQEELRRTILLKTLWTSKPENIRFETACSMLDVFESPVEDKEMVYPAWFVTAGRVSYIEFLEVSKPFEEAWSESQNDLKLDEMQVAVRPLRFR